MMTSINETIRLEKAQRDAAVNRELARIAMIERKWRVNDIEAAEKQAYWREEVLTKRKVALENELRDDGKWSDDWVRDAGRYIHIAVGYDHDGRLKITNADLKIEGTYHRAAISYTGENEFARVDCGEEERRGPFCGTYGLGSCITAHRSARCPEITVTDGDVLSINCRDFRVRVYRNQYIALDRIEKDGSLTPQGAHK